jgi:hypothetical protein
MPAVRQLVRCLHQRVGAPTGWQVGKPPGAAKHRHERQWMAEAEPVAIAPTLLRIHAIGCLAERVAHGAGPSLRIG